MRLEADLHGETATLEAAQVPAAPTLDEVLASVSKDAASSVTEYLRDTVVPHGGE